MHYFRLTTYPPYPVVEPAIREALTDWESRAILTPVPFADWGTKERALQNDFLLLPADPPGQLHLIQALAEKQLHQDTYLKQQTEAQYSAEYVDFRDVDELREYAGEELFQWLAALALYPRIRWEVVLEMGRALMPSEAVNFMNLLKLARISWMYEGSFPDLIRFKLLKALTPANEAIARQTLLTMLNYAERYFPGKHFFDGEKYLLQTSSQFSLYAYDAEAFVGYKQAHEAFGKLYKQGLYPDGAMLRYLENPNGEWTTLLPASQASASSKAINSASGRPRSIPLQDYLDKVEDEVVAGPTPLVEEQVRKDPRRTLALGTVAALLSLFALLYTLSGRPGNQVIDWTQQIPVTVVLDTNACVTPLNTSLPGSPRWTIFLDDFLFSINNLTGTRSLTLRNSSVVGNDIASDSVTLRTVIAVRDTTAGGEQQSRTVAFSRDTLHVRITCPYPVTASVKQSTSDDSSKTVVTNTTSRLRVSVEYTNPKAPDFSRIQAFMNTLATSKGYEFIRPLKPAVYAGRSQVRYFRPADRAAAEALAKLASQSLGEKIGTLLTKDERSPLTHLELWLNNGFATQQFICQALPSNWANKFSGWKANVKGYRYTVEVNGNQIRIQSESPDAPPTVDPKTGAQYAIGTALSIDLSGSIAVICKKNGLYLVRTASRGYTPASLIVRNVTRTSCSIAVVSLDTRLLNGPNGQTYFNGLVQRASFRRYAPPKPPQPANPVSASTSVNTIDQKSPKSSKSGPANPYDVQQTAKPGNDNEPAVNQVDKKVQAPVRTDIENLRPQSRSLKDETVQEGIRAYQGGQYEKAIKAYEKAIQSSKLLARNPANGAYVWNLKGYSLFKLERYDEAVTALLTATKADPKYAWAYFDLARVYCKMGRTAEAASARRQAIELQPDMRTIMQNDREFISLCGSEASAK